MKLALVSKLNAQSRIHAHTDKGIWIEEDQKYVTYHCCPVKNVNK